MDAFEQSRCKNDGLRGNGIHRSSCAAGRDEKSSASGGFSLARDRKLQAFAHGAELACVVGRSSAKGIAVLIGSSGLRCSI